MTWLRYYRLGMWASIAGTACSVVGMLALPLGDRRFLWAYALAGVFLLVGYRAIRRARVAQRDNR